MPCLRSNLLSKLPPRYGGFLGVHLPRHSLSPCIVGLVFPRLQTSSTGSLPPFHYYSASSPETATFVPDLWWGSQGAFPIQASPGSANINSMSYSSRRDLLGLGRLMPDRVPPARLEWRRLLLGWAWLPHHYLEKAGLAPLFGRGASLKHFADSSSD